MSLLRPLARVLTSSIYLSSGYAAIQNPAGPAAGAAGFMDQLRSVVPVSASNEQLVQANGAVQLIAGSTLALGIMPRLSALALAGSLVPTTVAGHAYWEADDPSQRSAQQIQFFKNLSMLGGLVYIVGTRA